MSLILNVLVLKHLFHYLFLEWCSGLFKNKGSNVLNIYGIEHSDMKLNLFGWKTNFGEAIFQSINPLFILLLAPIISLLWQSLELNNLACQ